MAGLLTDGSYGSKCTGEPKKYWILRFTASLQDAGKACSRTRPERDAYVCLSASTICRLNQNLDEELGYTVRARFVLLLACVVVCGRSQLLLSPDPLAVSTLAVPDSTKALLRSGYDYNDGNYDSGNLIRVEPAGRKFTDPDAEWVVFDAEGPGAITSIWFTGKNKAGKAYIGGNLKLYFDGEQKASVVAPLPELFEDGNLWPHPLAENLSAPGEINAPNHAAVSPSL